MRVSGRPKGIRIIYAPSHGCHMAYRWVEITYLVALAADESSRLPFTFIIILVAATGGPAPPWQTSGSRRSATACIASDRQYRGPSGSPPVSAAFGRLVGRNTFVFHSSSTP